MVNVYSAERKGTAEIIAAVAVSEVVILDCKILVSTKNEALQTVPPQMKGQRAKNSTEA